MPFVAAATVAALLILGLALVPAYVVPWYRMSVVLEDHREHFTARGEHGPPRRRDLLRPDLLEPIAE